MIVHNSIIVSKTGWIICNSKYISFYANFTKICLKLKFWFVNIPITCIYYSFNKKIQIELPFQMRKVLFGFKIISAKDTLIFFSRACATNET